MKMIECHLFLVRKKRFLKNGGKRRYNEKNRGFPRFFVCHLLRTLILVEEGGFGPPKSLTTDLQSAPFGRSGIPPYGAGDRSRTNNLLITNQLLCH